MRASPRMTRARRVSMTLFAAVTLLASSALGASKYKVLHNFGSSNDGSVPFGPLTLDGKGNLYGVTFDGGTGLCSDYGCGTVFELKHLANGTWQEAILNNFTAGSGGSAPEGGLIFGSAGNIYGTMLGDLSFAVGGIFELSPSSGGWSYTLTYSGNAGPGLLIDKAGNLYGDIGPGQYKYYGAIAELSRGSNGWNYTALYSFCGQYRCPEGYNLPAPPIWDGKGNLFGTTEDGGIGQPACWTSAGCGVIFEMTPNGDGTWTYHVLHRFASFPTDGQSPDGGLAMDASGNLYGVTGLGGVHNHGTVFKFTFRGGQWRQTVLYDFPNCADGCYPGRTPVFDKLGDLYGVSDGGLPDCGGYTCGVVFKLTPQKNGAWTYSVVHKFAGNDGAFPWGVIVDDKGNLFGTTENGGTYNAGVAFEITP